MTGFEGKLALLFIALGIGAPVPVVVGGMLLGLGCSYAGMLFTPPTERIHVAATLFSGLLFCIVVAGAQPHLPFGADKFALQPLMAVTGFSARWIGGSLVAFGRGVAERAGKLPGDIKLPGGDK